MIFSVLPLLLSSVGFIIFPIFHCHADIEHFEYPLDLNSCHTSFPKKAYQHCCLKHVCIAHVMFLAVFHVPRNRKHSFCICLRILSAHLLFLIIGMVNSNIQSHFVLVTSDLYRQIDIASSVLVSCLSSNTPNLLPGTGFIE